MFYTERQRQILSHLETNKNISVRELADLLFASTSTIRRDLSELESFGVLKRIHGGAILTGGANVDATAPYRQIQRQEEKDRIAQLAFPFLSGSTNYFFDSSSTVRSLALKLTDYKDVRIATNGLCLLSMLHSTPNLSVVSCGGYLRSPHDEFTGTVAVQAIQNMSADYFFFSCAGFSLAQGATEFSDENVAVKHAFFQHSKKHILLCDHTKFGKEYFFKSFDIRDIDYVITDKKPDDRTFIDVLGDRLIYPSV
ncbi:MAG: DeoR/GlpR transcriptional regulator [Lachnospiraceae bacterium]|nr:DeoR/GlpR transcriptional regulator [Lachnospiraceae bacterium]